MGRTRGAMWPWYWAVCLALCVATLLMLVFLTPVDATAGVVQKIFYLHVPLAINTFLGAFILFVASVGYLWQRTRWWDDLGAASGKVTVLLCGGMLVTGMLWAKSAWGSWWVWSPRLTFSLVLFVLYVIYVIIRRSIESAQRRAFVGAVYGIVAFLDVPLVYLSSRVMPDVHPSSVSLEPWMVVTLLSWVLVLTMITLGLIMARVGLAQDARALDAGGGASAPDANGGGAT